MKNNKIIKEITSVLRKVTAKELAKTVQKKNIAIADFASKVVELNNSQTKLKNTNSRLNALIAGLDDLVFVLDRQLVIKEYYAPLDKQTVIKPEMFLGKSFDKINFPEPAHTEIKKALKQAIKTNKPTDVVYYLDDSGKRLWYELRIREMNGNNGDTGDLICVARDITARYQAEAEQNKAEQELANNEMIFRAIFELSPVSIFLVDLDGYFRSVNRATEMLLGYSEAELKKLTFGDITHPDEAKRDLGKIKDLVSGKIGVYAVEKRYIKKDKTIIFVRINATLIRDNDDKPLYFLTIAEDVTEHHRYLEKIRESEVKYSTLVEKSNDAVVVIQDKKFVFANKSAEMLFGYKSSEILNTVFMDVVSPKYKKLVYNMFSRRIKGEDVASRYELEVIMKDGAYLPIETSSSLIDYEGKPAVMALLRDMTKAKEIDRMKSEFIAVASHQLRTPLTGIKWFSQLLLADKEKSLTDSQKDFLTEINTSNERMIKLVNDLLDVSHIETGRKFSVDKKNIDIISIIKRVARSEILNNGSSKIKIEFDRELPSKLIIPIDDKKIEQVFINLISNSIKYSTTNKKIIIGAKKAGDNAVFYVKDFGVGIPKKQQYRIFEKFFRADNIATISQSGTGLGLYIVKSIIEGHGGKISFESKENKGTTFTFSVPLK